MSIAKVYRCWSILVLVLTHTIAAEKRILLQSQDDLIAVIHTLQTEVAALQTNVETLKVNVHILENINTTLQTEVETLRVKVNTLETINTTVAQNAKDVESLQANVKTLEASKQTPSGSDVYIRWGRTTCPSNGTEFVYSGYMAGSHWNEYGGGSNNLCLPEDPTWNHYIDGYNGGATIYGTEFELQGSVSTALFGKQAYNQDIPCSVCRTSASTVMLPARATCYPGWTMEYSGYMIGAHPNSKSEANYVCLDSGLEFVPHGNGEDDAHSHIVFPVEVQCGDPGGLPCPPYVQGRELACVVCSK